MSNDRTAAMERRDQITEMETRFSPPAGYCAWCSSPLDSPSWCDYCKPDQDAPQPIIVETANDAGFHIHWDHYGPNVHLIEILK